MVGQKGIEGQSLRGESREAAPLCPLLTLPLERVALGQVWQSCSQFCTLQGLGERRVCDAMKTLI